MDTSKLEQMKATAVKALLQLSMRERVLAGVALLVAVSMATYSMIIAPSVKAFAAQRSTLKDLETIYDVAPDILGRYAKLVARRKEIEGFYEKVDLKSDPLSYLERLLRESAQIPAGGYSVTPRDGVQLGEKYLHKIYTVKFEIANWQNLLRFLKDLTSGAQPMLLSQINLDKRQTADTLSVQLEVSGFAAISSDKS